MAREQRKQSGKAISGSIEIAGLKRDEEAPKLEIHALDLSGKVLGSAGVADDGRFSLPGKALEEADRIAIAAAGKDLEEIDASATISWRTRDFRSMLGEDGTLVLARPDWDRFRFTWRCVDGSVSRCFPYPWLVREMALDASRARLALFGQTESPSEQRELARLEDATIARPNVALPFFPRRCEKVCDGVVEVYRRRCCCRPWIVDDTRLLELIHNLQEAALKPIIIREPGDPGPEVAFVKQGALDEGTLRARADVAQIQALSGPSQAEYIQARPYLRPFWCSCGEAEKVGRGWIRPDGTFGFCWAEFPRFLPLGCHDEYAFVVKQAVGAEMVTIYDGPSANRWFDDPSGVSLVSYSARARGCGGIPPTTGGAVAYLMDIGDTPSHLLKTPDADAWDSVGAPVYNDGLLNPAATPAEGQGSYKDQNLGGTLKLRFYFSDDMKNTGAAYYRISVTEADGNGNPVGSRTALSQPISWNYGRWTGSEYLIESEGLGPVTRGTESNLFQIPYERADRHWHWGEGYHGFLETTAFADQRHLVTLEVFDAAGKRLRPTGSSGAGKDAGFTFRRWYQPTGPTAAVPFAALTHMFWWDNRKAAARIEELYKDGVASGAQCQFISGKDGSKFSVGYRAYHPNPMFILNHVMWWRRGLGGPSGTLVSSPANAGQPPAPMATTNPADGVPPATFLNMLEGEKKCSFALNLQVNVKTTDGEGILTGLDAYDQAAFALERK